MPGDLTRPTVSLVPAEDRSEASAAALNLAAGSIGSINMSVDIDGTTYAGEALGTLRESHGPSWPPPLHVVSRFQGLGGVSSLGEAEGC